MSTLAIDEIEDERLADAQRVIEYCYEQGWTDGLPVVPPVESLVREFVDYVKRDPQEVVVTVPHLDRVLTVELAAANAVMAGCRPEYFPIVLAAIEALDRGNFGWYFSQSTTGRSAPIIINGPIRQRYGFNSGVNVFGPGHRANATVGRAVRLIIANGLGIRPGEFDQSTQGNATKYSFCIAENEEDSPWEPLHVERGFSPETSTVTAFYTRSSMHVENRESNNPEEVLLTIADSMSYGGLVEYDRRGHTVVMGPEHAQLLARKGWSKQDAKQFLWEHWGRRRADIRSFGFISRLTEGPEDEFIRFGESPDAIVLIVAGANSAGLSTVVTGRPHLDMTNVIHEPGPVA